jgi:hypothetical protein
MPWYDHIQSIEESRSFTAWLQDHDTKTGYADRRSVRVYNFTNCVSATLNDQPVPGQAPLQSQREHGRLADILATFNTPVGSPYWTIRGMGSAQFDALSAQVIAADPGGNRDAAKFEQIGAQFFVGAQNTNNRRLALDQLKLIRDARAGELNALVEQYLAAYLDEASHLSAKAARSLKDLRSHQRMKIEGKRVLGVKKGGHTSGQYYLRLHCADAKPILLVSSAPDKAIKQEYLALVDAQKSALSRDTVLAGTFSINGATMRFTEKVGYSGSKNPAPYRDALQALGVKSITAVQVT